MQEMSADIASPWDDLVSDIRAHKVHLRHGIFACWEEAIADLGLSSLRSYNSCSAF